MMLDFVEPGGFMFKFDIKQGYHHIDIRAAQQFFLGFSWLIEGILRYFMYTVLTFGISSAPFNFNKTMRPLVKYWRMNSIKVACFIDDGGACDQSIDRARSKSKFVQATLSASGFVVNEQKSIWEPTKSLPKAYQGYI